jgi:hypothetical protein
VGTDEIKRGNTGLLVYRQIYWRLVTLIVIGASFNVDMVTPGGGQRSYSNQGSQAVRWQCLSNFPFRYE